MHSIDELIALNNPRPATELPQAVAADPAFNIGIGHALSAAVKPDLAEATKLAEPFSAEQIEDYAVDVLGWEYDKAVAFSRYLKGEGSYNSLEGHLK